MSSRFNSSADFNAFTITAIKHLKKTKLNELRHAIALTEGFKDVRPYTQYLDNQATNSRSDLKFMRELSTHVFHKAVDVVFSTLDAVDDWSEVPCEGFIDPDVIPFPACLAPNKLANVAHGDLLDEFTQEGANESAVAQLTWEYALESACAVVVQIMDKHLDSGEGVTEVALNGVDEAKFLQAHRERYLGELHRELTWHFLDGSAFEQ